MRSPGTCHYCHLTHPKVEAGGVWYCPNPLCTGPGAAYFRAKLKSYHEEAHGRHSVDSDEMAAFGLAYARDLIDDAPLTAHIRASVGKWKTFPATVP